MKIKIFILDLEATEKELVLTLHQMNIIHADLTPLYPMFESFVSRYDSFYDYEWPKDLSDYAVELADFGFFFIKVIVSQLYAMDAELF